jgi:hypothetical protein
MRGHCFDLGGYHGRVIRSVNLFHYMLFFLVTHPRDAGDIDHALNEFEQRQLVEWTPKAEDFLKGRGAAYDLFCDRVLGNNSIIVIE